MIIKRAKKIRLEALRLIIDMRCVRGNTVGIIFLILFRLFRILHLTGIPVFSTIVSFSYNIIMRLFFCAEFSLKIDAGAGLCVFHGIGMVVHEKTRFMRNVVIRQNCTIGTDRFSGKGIVVPRGCQFGAGCVVLSEEGLHAFKTIKACSVVK